MKDVHEELRATLRDAAEAHEPDRARILARSNAAWPARRVPGTPRRGRPRSAGSVSSVPRLPPPGVLAVGGYAVASAVKDDKAADQTVATSPHPRPVAGGDEPCPGPAGPGQVVAPARQAEYAELPDGHPRPTRTAPRTGAPADKTPTARCGRTARSTRTATSSGRRAM
jgi:hypothetical protein